MQHSAATELEHVIKLVGRSPRLYALRALDANSLAPYHRGLLPTGRDGTDKPGALTTKWRAVQVMGTRCSIDSTQVHSDAATDRSNHRVAFGAEWMRPYVHIRTRPNGAFRSSTRSTLVAAAIRHFKQHTVNTGFPR